jgi:GTP-binding protein
MHSTTPPTRTIAIVGRPNVGKSAIFNRLLRRRLAIVHDEPGVTRDRIVAEARWDEEVFTLIDTGGIGLMDRAREGDEIAAAARVQVEAALDDAAAVILVVDTQAGVVPLDEEVARLLRARARPVIVAANKADHPRHDDAADEFVRLGFPVFPVSALHSRGFEDLMEVLLKHLPPPAPAETAAAPLVVTVAGRPNAGKSSYINRMLRRERLVVSSIPGTTRDSIEVPFAVGTGPQARRYLLVDTAGMRPAGRVDSAVEKFSLIRVEEAIHRSDLVVLIFDALQGPTRQDKRIADLVLEARRGCILVVNKWDLAGKMKQDEYREALRRELPFLAFAPLHFISAKTGEGVAETIESFDRVASQISMTFTTGVLNRVLRDVFAKKSPPSVKGRRLKLYYATQVGVRPLRLKMFVNDPDLVVPAYRKFLESRVRAKFGLEGAPLVFLFTAREREE